MSLTNIIALRYLFSKKSHNAINLISAIAVGGIVVATAAMVCTLSVFNGFRDLIGSLYTTFDPQIVVVPSTGKYAPEDDMVLQKVQLHPAVAASSATLEQNALILFRGHPLVVYIKGVDKNFEKVTAIRSILVNPKRKPFVLSAAGVEYGVLGQGLAQQIGTLDFEQLQICAPRDGERINLANPIESFSVQDLHSSGMAFSVNQRKYDESYILTSKTFAEDLFEKPGQLSRLELKLKPDADLQAVKEELRHIVGNRYKVLDRMEQQADVFNIMNVEKLIAYVFLTFIVLIACFNIISSLSMLIIEKRDDAETLRHLGLTHSRIRGIFVREGMFISTLGAVLGLALGGGLCWLQQEYGLIQFGSGQNFIIPAYPVSVHLTDIALILATVIGVGFLSVWIPVQVLTKRLLQ
jgi:putative membrane protein